MTQTTDISAHYPYELPSDEVQRGLLATAIGRDLDGLADMLGHESRADTVKAINACAFVLEARDGRPQNRYHSRNPLRNAFGCG